MYGQSLMYRLWAQNERIKGFDNFHHRESFSKTLEPIDILFFFQFQTYSRAKTCSQSLFYRLWAQKRTLDRLKISTTKSSENSEDVVSRFIRAEIGVQNLFYRLQAQNKNFDRSQI